MAYGGPPKLLGPEFEALQQQRERERDAERANVALEAETSRGRRWRASALDRVRRVLGRRPPGR